jgi:FdrA protein
LVLGEGAHPDPASEIGPVVAELLEKARVEERTVEVVCIIVGTEEDPQDLQGQISQMREAGASVYQEISQAVAHVIDLSNPAVGPTAKLQETGLLNQPLAAINVGLDIFSESVHSQGAEVVSVDWRPPAGGDDKLAGLLALMK